MGHFSTDQFLNHKTQYRTIWGFLLLFLYGCGATQDNNLDVSNSIDLPAYQLTDYSDLNRRDLTAKQKVSLFQRSDFTTVISPYLVGLQALDTLTFENYCEPKVMALYDKLLDLNASSIFAKTIKLGCQSELLSEEEYLQEMAEIGEIATVLLETGSGESVETAIQIRELSEIYTIMELAGLSVLDVDTVLHQGLAYYKLHTLDSVTNKFEYRYASNYRFFTSAFKTLVNQKVSSQTSSDFLVSSLKTSKAANISPHLLRTLAYQGKHREALDSASDLGLSPLSEILVAQMALMLEEDAVLEGYLDSILEYSEAGLIEANAFVALFLFIKDPDAAWNDIQAELQNIDELTQDGWGTTLLLNNLALRSDYQQQLEKFLAMSAPSAQEEVYRFAASLDHNNDSTPYDFDDIVMASMEVLSELDYAKAQLHLASKLFAKSDATEEEQQRAKYLLEASADSGYDEAQLTLGVKYTLAKDGYAKDLRKAYDYYLSAAEQNNAWALQNLAEYNKYGLLGEVDVPLAIDFYERAIEAGQTHALCDLGDVYRTVMEEPDFDKARETYQLGLQRINSSEDALPCYEGLGMISMFVEEDFDQAIQYLDIAVKNDSGFAAYYLGTLYDQPHYGKQDFTLAMSYYRRALQLDFYDAAANLGYIYESGKDGNEPDLEKALHYYKLGAEAEEPQAMNNLGTFYLHAKGVKQDVEKAIQLFQQAADMGNDFAASNYADILWDGEYVDANYIEACRYYELAYELYYLDAYYDLAFCYSEGQGKQRDTEKAIQILREGIDEGDDYLIFELGVVLRLDEQDAEAESYLKKAIELGYEDAYLELATLYEDQGRDKLAYNTYYNASAAGLDFEEQLLFMQWSGQGTRQNKTRALEGLTDFAIRHSKDPNMYLGDKFYFGYFGEPNYKQAFHYYSKVTDDPRVFNNLGEMYKLGQFVDVDLAKAAELYELSASMGHRTGINSLADMYLDGVHFEKDVQKAGELFLQAAELSSTFAMLKLSKLYMTGDMSPPDEKDAEYWLLQLWEDSDEAMLLLPEVLLLSNNPEKRKKGLYWLNLALQSELDGAKALADKFGLNEGDLVHD